MTIIDTINADLELASSTTAIGLTAIIAGSITDEQAAAIDHAINTLAWLAVNVNAVSRDEIVDVLDSVGPIFCDNLPNFFHFEAQL